MPCKRLGSGLGEKRAKQPRGCCIGPAQVRHQGSGFLIHSEHMRGMANACPDPRRKAGDVVGKDPEQLEPGGRRTESRKEAQREFCIAANRPEDERGAELPERGSDPPGGIRNVVCQVEFHRSVQFPGDSEDALGKTEVFLPALQAGEKPVGMQRLELAGMDEADVFRHQAFSSCPFQIGPVPVAGQHPQLVVACEALDGGPAYIQFRPQIGIAGNGGDEDFHVLVMSPASWVCQNSVCFRPAPVTFTGVKFFFESATFTGFRPPHSTQPATP